MDGTESDLGTGYQLEHRDGGWRLMLGGGCVFFRGHFPGQPLLPAYATLLLLRDVVKRQLGLAPLRWQWRGVKLLRPLLPGGDYEVKWEQRGDGSVNLTISEEAGVCFSGRFVSF